MEILAAIFIGVVGATAVNWAVVLIFMPTTTTVPRTYSSSLSPRLETLARHGKIKTVYVSTKKPKQTNNELMNESPTRTYIPEFLVRILQNWLHESDESFAMWWSDTMSAERKRLETTKGRHRYDVLSLDESWRTRWAKYDTQWWPTVATDGNASTLIQDPELSMKEWLAVLGGKVSLHEMRERVQC